jgi:hypothetical protein
MRRQFALAADFSLNLIGMEWLQVRGVKNPKGFEIYL